MSNHSHEKISSDINPTDILNKILATNDPSKVMAIRDYLRSLPYFEERMIGHPKFQLGEDSNAAVSLVGKCPFFTFNEDLTNAIDAIIARYMHENNIDFFPSPREALRRIFGTDTPFHLLDQGKKTKLQAIIGDQVVVRTYTHENTVSNSVRDFGIGVSSDDAAKTILGIFKLSKDKPWTFGRFGQGRSTVYRFCEITVVASRKIGTDDLWFTLIYEHPHYRGQYVYLVMDGNLMTAEPSKVSIDEVSGFLHGTLVKHINYNYMAKTARFPTKPNVGDTSLYTFINRMLFDIPLPVRVVYAGDKSKHETDRKTRRDNCWGGKTNLMSGDGVRYKSVGIPIKIGNGEIRVDVFLLDPETSVGKKNDKKAKKAASNDNRSTNGEYPTKSYVNKFKPVILSYNGINQGEQSDVPFNNLPYLKRHLIGNIDCTNLDQVDIDNLFGSDRMSNEHSEIYKQIMTEYRRFIDEDEELRSLNEQAMMRSTNDRDTDLDEMLKDHIRGLLGNHASKQSGGSAGGKANGMSGNGVLWSDIELKKDPTFVRFRTKNDVINLEYGCQTQYVHIETDATPDYVSKNPIQFHDTTGVVQLMIDVATNDAGHGRLVIGLGQAAMVGLTGEIGLSMNGVIGTDTKTVKIVAPVIPLEVERKKRNGNNQSTGGEFRSTDMPDVQCVFIGPENQEWDIAFNGADPFGASFNGIKSGSKFIVYFNREFPPFKNLMGSTKNVDKQTKMRKEYQTYLSGHAFLMEMDRSADVEIDTNAELKEFNRAAKNKALQLQNT